MHKNHADYMFAIDIYYIIHLKKSVHNIIHI